MKKSVILLVCASAVFLVLGDDCGLALEDTSEPDPMYYCTSCPSKLEVTFSCTHVCCDACEDPPSVTRSFLPGSDGRFRTPVSERMWATCDHGATESVVCKVELKPRPDDFTTPGNDSVTWSPSGVPSVNIALGGDTSGQCPGYITFSDNQMMGAQSVLSGGITVYGGLKTGLDVVSAKTVAVGGYSNVRILKDAKQERIMQVLSKECLVTVSGAKDDLNMTFWKNDPAAVTYDETMGYYTVDTAKARQLVDYRIGRSTSGGTNGTSVVSVTKVMPGAVEPESYELRRERAPDGTERHVLSRGGGLSDRCFIHRMVGTKMLVSEELSGNGVSYVKQESVYSGADDRAVLLKKVSDPNGANLSAEYAYEDENGVSNGCASACNETSGMRRTSGYDEQSRVVVETESSPGLPERRTVYSYSPIGVRPHCPEPAGGFCIPADDGLEGPGIARSETAYVGDVVVSKILRFVSLDTMKHRIVEEVRLACPASTNSIAFEWDNPANVRTYTDYMPYSDCKPCSELPSLVMRADGTIDRYAYSAGVYSNGVDGAAGVFTDSGCGEGDWFRTVVTHYAAGDVEVPNVTTRDVKIEIRSSKKILLQEQYVCTAPGAYARVSWTATTRDDLGQETLVVKSDGTRVEKAYAGRRLVSIVGADGLMTTNVYDALGRVIAETKSGGGVRPDTTISTTYDPEDRVLSRTVTAGDLSETETYAYDALGRTVSAIDSSGIETRYLYATDSTVGLETRTTIRAFGSDCAVTNTTISYADGRTKETLLNGVAKTAYEYGPNWTKTYEGPAGLASPRWSCSYEDALGRTICETRPGFRGALLVTSNEYNTANQLVATRTYSLEQPVLRSLGEGGSSNSSPSPLTYTLICYNSLGQRTLTVSDMNLNGQIDWSDTDRIVSNDTQYVSLNGDWWRESSTWQTRQNGSPELTLMGRSRTRLTRIGKNGEAASSPLVQKGSVLISETRSLDPLNNATVSCTYLDRSSHTTTQTTLSPDSTLPAETVVQSGLTVSSRSPTGVTTTYAYDALGRQIAQTDGRGNTSHLVYDAQGRVAKTIDPLGNETTYSYDALGRQVAVTDPLGHAVTTTYDAEGRVTSLRGATYPVDYAYDVYGNKVSMTTYRNENLTNGDTTRWLYDEPSGCMTNKLYADGKGPSYSYTPDGKLARRTWARGIATDYTYDNAGNLTRTEYDDNGVTPTITMSYDRVGNLINATAAGVVTNLYAYDLYGHCTNEWQNDFQLTRFYDALGRSTGYAINGTRQTTIAYDTYGRIATMRTAEGRSGVLTASNENEFAWSYLPNSDFKASLQYPNGLTASWTYDANNQLLQVRNATPTNVISQFDYTYDAAGRRTAIVKSGSAFGDLSGSIESYAYNARSELTSARRTKNGQPIPGFSEDFDYDPIGNRRSSATYNEKGEVQTSTYVANNLNQYTTRTTPGYAAVRGEADPNATVTVNENPTFRLGSYYFGSDIFDNTAAGGLANLATYATLSQPAQNGEETEDLVSATTNQVYLAQSPETFAYDDDGNQTLITTATGRWRVTYNGENRPILWECVTPDSNTQTLVSMSYDRMGRRVTKNGQRFVYDGYLQIVNFEQSVTNSQLTTHNLQLFIWDPTEPVATRPLVWGHHDGATSLNFEPSNLNFYTHDGNKNVSEVVAEDGDIAAHYVYAPFGAMNAQTGTHATANLLRFSSEYADDVLGLVYYNYRHYEPVMGRWTCRDPVEEIVGGNTWTFCKNYSLNAYDVIGFWGDDGHGRGNMDTGLSGTPCPMPDFINEDRFLERDAKSWQIWKIKRPITSPFVVPWLHFRDLSDSERLMSGAVAECDIAKYESYGHQLQDYYSHYGQNYRWYYLGHVPDSLIVWLQNSLGLRYFAMPDDTEDFAEDFAKAKLRMADWNGRWKECCCCSENRTWIVRQGRNEIRCKGGLDDAPPPVSGPNKPQFPNILPRFPVRVPDVRFPNNVHTEWFPTPGVIFQMSF